MNGWNIGNIEYSKHACIHQGGHGYGYNHFFHCGLPITFCETTLLLDCHQYDVYIINTKANDDEW